METNFKPIKQISAKDKILSIISHDLRGVFHGILGLTQLLVDKSEINDYERIGNLSFELNKAAKRGYSLLESLLYWASIQTGHLKIYPKNIYLRGLIERAAEQQRISLIEKKIDLQNSVDSNFQLLADPFMLETIIRNLISNAIKYNKVEGTIKITAKQSYGLTKICVEDTGIGIKKDYLSNIFNLGPMKTSQSTACEHGSGLGLFLCKDFVEMHDGNIWAESTDGVGSKIFFTIKNDDPLMN